MGERRNGDRVKARLKIEVFRVGDVHPIEGLTAEVSPAGLSVEFPRAIPLGRDVVLKIYPFASEIPTQIRASVRWIIRRDSHGRCRVGCEFSPVFSNALHKVRALLGDYAAAV